MRLIILRKIGHKGGRSGVVTKPVLITERKLQYFPASFFWPNWLVIRRDFQSLISTKNSGALLELPRTPECSKNIEQEKKVGIHTRTKEACTVIKFCTLHKSI